eukprot:5704398-Pyramimonas_sp.AAC.1
MERNLTPICRVSPPRQTSAQAKRVTRGQQPPARGTQHTPQPTQSAGAHKASRSGEVTTRSNKHTRAPQQFT